MTPPAALAQFARFAVPVGAAHTVAVSARGSLAAFAFRNSAYCAFVTSYFET